MELPYDIYRKNYLPVRGQVKSEGSKYGCFIYIQH